MKAKAILKSQKGLATLESVVLLIVFVVLATYTIGFFGIIHTGIKNSIGARNLAFETFRNRANLVYWRDNSPQIRHFKSKGYRNHGIISELAEGAAGSASPYYASARQIAFVRNPEFRRTTLDGQIKEANSVFIKTKYGICLNVECGD